MYFDMDNVWVLIADKKSTFICCSRNEADDLDKKYDDNGDGDGSLFQL